MRALLFSTNMLIILTIIVIVFMIFTKIKNNTNGSDFFIKAYITMLFLTLCGSVVSLYIAIMELFLQQKLFIEIAINQILIDLDIIIFSFSAFFALMFLLMTYYQLAEYKRDASKRLQAISLLKESLDDFYTYMDNAIYDYFKGLKNFQNSLRYQIYFTRLKDDVACMECMVNVYYGLIYKQDSFKELKRKILRILRIFRSEDIVFLKNTIRSNTHYFNNAQAVCEKIYDKIQEISFLLEQAGDIIIKRDNEKLKIVIKKDPSKEASIQDIFETLAIIITDNKYVCDDLKAILNEKEFSIKQLLLSK
jgi:hypothetical protein